MEKKSSIVDQKPRKWIPSRGFCGTVHYPNLMRGKTPLHFCHLY